jgi:hypothetical protein
MKNYRRLEPAALAILAAGYLMLPAARGAVGSTDSAEITKLLADTRALAVQLKTDSDQMESFTRSKSSWESYAGQLHTIRNHVNNAGQLVTKLKDAESTGSHWQQMTIKRIEPLLQEMADNLTATINHLNNNRSRIHFPEYVAYVKANYTLSADLEALVRASIDSGKDEAEFVRLSAA